jgi:alkanesulfonate monooxygenase SsuD/methylene tetrahydromethanopterin reductase-like flavin-dependent oxidoreductase (luciferase family)
MVELAERVALYRSALAEAGHEPRQFQVGAHFHVLVGEDPAEARRLGREALERHWRQSMNSRALDTEAPVRPEFRAMAAASGEIDVDEFIRHGRALIGTPDECVALVERARDEVGIDCINCTFSWGGIDESSVERSMQLFATEVMPRARGATVSR